MLIEHSHRAGGRLTPLPRRAAPLPCADFARDTVERYKPADPCLIPAPSSPKTLTSLNQVQDLVGELVENSFPELKGKEIAVRPFRSDDSFFESQPSIVSILNIFSPVSYRINVNPTVFEKDLPLSAARAILAHELCHTLEYVNRGLWGMLDALSTVFHRGHRIHNERETDMETLNRGFHQGLSEYRTWIYPQLTPEDEKEKRQVYFSPEEIAELEKIRKEKPDLFQHFRHNPPRSLEEIRAKAKWVT